MDLSRPEPKARATPLESNMQCHFYRAAVIN